MVDDLVRNASERTPPQVSPSKRLMSSQGAVDRSTHFTTLAISRGTPSVTQSPEIDQNVEEREDMFFGVNEWEDIPEEPPVANSVQRPRGRPSESGFRRKSTRRSTVHFVDDEFVEGPSLTLRDILLKVGQDGILGANGTFNFDLMREYLSGCLKERDADYMQKKRSWRKRRNKKNIS